MNYGSEQRGPAVSPSPSKVPLRDCTKDATGGLPTATAELYANYGEFKHWQAGFAHTADEQELFAGELRGIELERQRVLEIGFGSGALLSWCRGRGAEVTGLEIQPELVEAGRHAGYRVFERRLEEARELDGERFDLILAFDVFEHVPADELPKLLARARELLADGGRIVARFPNGQSPLGRIFQYADATHCQVLSVPTLAQIAAPLGLAVERGGNSWRSRSGSPIKRAAKRCTALVRDAVECSVALVYGLRRVPFDANVTVVLRHR